MRIDFNVVKTLLERAEADSPFGINPQLPVIDFNENGPPGTFSVSIATPRDDGVEFLHWRWMADTALIRVSHDGRPGLGKLNNRVEGLLALGHELFELSRDTDRWQRVTTRCAKASASTLGMLMSELRSEAKRKLKTLN